MKLEFSRLIYSLHRLFIYLFVFSLFFGHKNSIFLIYPMIATSLYFNIRDGFGLKNIWVLSPLLFGSALIIHDILVNYPLVDMKIWEKYFPLFLFTLFLNVKGISLNKVLIFFSAGFFLSVFTNLSIALFHSLNLVENSLVFNAAIVKRFSFFKSISIGGNYFFSSDFSNFMHTTYYAMYALFVFAFISLMKIEREIGKKKYIILLCIVLLAIFIISSKAGIFSLVLVVIYIYRKYRFFFRNRFNRLVVYSIIIILSVLFFANPRVLRIYQDYKAGKLSYENPTGKYSNESRVMVWKTSLQLIADNPIGYGLSNVQNRLLNGYIVNQFKFPLEKRYNSHNQYFHIFLSGGVIVFLFFVWMIYSLFSAKKNMVNQLDRHLLSVFLILILFNFLFENVLSRYEGISFFAFFIAFFLKKSVLRGTNSFNSTSF